MPQEIEVKDTTLRPGHQAARTSLQALTFKNMDHDSQVECLVAKCKELADLWPLAPAKEAAAAVDPLLALLLECTHAAAGQVAFRSEELAKKEPQGGGRK